MSDLTISTHEAAGATLGVKVTATLVGTVDGEQVPVTGIVTGTDIVIVRPTTVRITELPYVLDLHANTAISPANTAWLVDVGGDEFLISKGAGSETLEDCLIDDLAPLSLPVMQQAVADEVAAITADGDVTGPLDSLAIAANAVDTAAIAPEAVTSTELAGEVAGVVDPLTDLTGWTDATTVLPDAYDALGVVTGGVGVPTPTSGAIGLADEAAGHGLRYRDLGLTAPCSVMVQIDPRYWPAEGGPALFVDLTKSEGWFAPVMTRDLFPPAPATPYFWLASGGRTNATITARDLHAFTAAEEALYMDPERPAGPVWLEVRVDASWTATMWVDGVQIEDLAATIPVALRGSTSHGFYVDVNQTDENGGAGGTRPQDLPVICGPFVARSLVSADDAVAGGGEVALHAGASLTAKGGRVDRLTVVPPVRLYSLGDVAQPALVVRATDGGSDVLTVDDDAVTATVPTVATAVGVSGIAGATQGMRLVGKIATGTPTTGALGDVVLVADTGEWKLCTVAGTPGTWTTIGGGGSLDIAGLPPVASTDNGTDGRTRLDPTDSLPALVDGVQSEITLNELAALMAGMDNPKKITGSHTLDMATETTIVSDDASSYVLTLPHVDAADLPVRPITTVQLGTGAITVTAGASAWILGSANRKTTRGQYTSQSYVPLFDLTGTTLWAPIDHGEVVGPSSSTSGNLASMSGTTGRLIADSGVAPDTSTALGTSDAKVPTQKAVKTYIDGRTPAASDTATGVVELATTAETQTGTDTARAVTPAGAAATYIPASLVDAAGDLIVGTANDTAGRLGIGAASNVLRVNSGATALEWAAAHALEHTPTTGTWAAFNAERSSITTNMAGLGKQSWVPIWLAAGTYDRIAVYVITGATSTWRLGLDAISANAVPTGSPLLDAGTVDMSGAAGQRAITISHTVAVTGWYWCRAKVEAYTANPTVVAHHGSTGAHVAPPFPGWPTQAASYLRSYPGLYYDGVGSGGALTAPPSLTNNSATGLAYAEMVPVIWMRRA